MGGPWASNPRRGLTMDPRPAHRGRPFFALMSAFLAATPSCSPDGDARVDANVERSDQALVESTPSKFTLFESGQVRPLSLSPDKRYLFAVNTPDNRLEVFRVFKNQLVHKVS